MRARLSLLVAVAFALLGLVVPATSAGAAPVAYPATLCPTLSVSTTMPLVGATITVSGVNFDPNATIKLELESKPWLLATVKSDAQGAFTVNVKLPAGVFGSHLIVAVGGTTQRGPGCPVDPSQLLHIQNPGTSGGNGGGNGNGGGTAFTGVDVLLLVLLAAVLLSVGVAINRSGKRRKQTEAEWYLT
jgi:hypothetical protein